MAKTNIKIYDSCHRKQIYRDTTKRVRIRGGEGLGTVLRQAEQDIRCRSSARQSVQYHRCRSLNFVTRASG